MRSFEKLQFRRGEAAQWTAANPVLLAGEPGYELDTGALKIGDGTTAWNDLGYYQGGDVNAENYVTSYTRIRNPNLLDGIFRYNGGGGLIETNAFGTASEYYIPEWNGSDLLSSLDARGRINGVVPDNGYWGDDLPAGTSFTCESGLYRWTMLGQLKVGATVEAGDVLYAYIDTGLCTDSSFANNDTPPLFLATSPNPRLLQLGGTLLIETDGQVIVPAITTDADTTLEECQYLSFVLWKLQ